MHISIIFFLYGAQIASAAALKGCNADNCYRAVKAGASPSRPGLADCSSYFLKTVTAQHTSAPTAIPAYASSCSGTVRYSSACSCLGVTASTITISASTSNTASPTATNTPGLTIAPLAPTATSSSPPDTVASAPVTISPTNVLPTTTNSADISASTQKPIQFGFNSDDGTSFFLDVNLIAKTGSTLVNLEQVAPFLTSITCSGGSSIQVMFSDATAYNIAATSWPQDFYLVASGSASCKTGSDNERDFYHVTAVILNAGANSITMSVSPSSLQDATEGVKATWGTVGTTAAAQRAKRGLGSESASSTYTVNSQTFTAFLYGMSLANGGEDGSPINCYGCGVFGTLVLSGGYDCDWHGCSGAGINAEFKDVDIYISFDYSTGGQYQVAKKFVIDTIAYTRIQVTGLFSLIPSVSLVATLEADLIGQILAINNIGLVGSITDATVDVDVLQGVTQNGWNLDNAKFLTPSFDYHTVERFEFKAAIGPVFDLDFKFLATEYDASISLESPQIDAVYTLNNSSTCGVPDAVASYDMDLDAHLDLFVTVEGDGVPSSLDHYTFYDKDYPLVSDLCIPFF